MAKVTFNRELCKGCGLCAAFCPRGVITRGEGYNTLGFVPVKAAADGCTGCGTCALMCPDVAIEVAA